ncbi:MAG: TolC family protein [Longimicrobiales bacterium]
MRTVIGLALALATCAAPALAQQPVQATLTLEEAVGLARRNNPDYLAQQNDAGVADWAVREAYGSLLPGASVSSSLAWQDAGTPRFGIFTGEDLGIGGSTSYYSSSYSVGLSYRLSGSTLLAPSREKAARRATTATIEAARFSLEANVTRQYLAVLRARDGVELARSELARAEENVRLAEARVEVGVGIPLEVKQAQVERGRAQVAILQSENMVRTERLRLGQTIGVPLELEVRLTTDFAVTDVPWQAEDLIATALDANPQIRAARASERASVAGVTMARTAYLPSLSMSAGFTGFTRQAGNEDFLVQQARDQITGQRENCQFQNMLSDRLTSPLPGRPADCSAFVLTPGQESQIRSGNDVFPFDFSREPLSVSLQLSLPVFQGFGRQRQVEEAKAVAADARYRVRSEELRVRTDVGAAYFDLVTARQTVALEIENQQLADDQLVQARERYRVGAAPFIELQEAETVKARADRAYLTAVYAFHEALAALETAVGRPLRTEIR